MEKSFEKMANGNSLENHYDLLDDTLGLMPGEDPVEAIYEKGPSFIYMIVSLSEYPYSPESLNSNSRYLPTKVKQQNQELKSLIDHIVNNNKQKSLFQEIAKNFSNDEEDAFKNYLEIKNSYEEELSKKSGIYEDEIITKDSVYNAIFDRIKQKNNSQYDNYGIFLEKDSLTS